MSEATTAGTLFISVALACSACSVLPSNDLAPVSAEDIQKVSALIEKNSRQSGDSFDYEMLRTNAARACLRAQGHKALPVPVAPPKQNQVQAWQDSLQWVATGKTQLTAFASDSRNFIEEPPLQNSKFMLTEEAGKLYWGYPEKTVEIDTGAGYKKERVISGCYGSVTNEVFGVDAATYEQTSATAKRAESVAWKAASHPDVRKKSDKYSRCMKKRNYTTIAPSEMPEEIHSLFTRVKNGTAQPDDVARAEKDFTEADKTCKAESKVANAFAAAYLADYPEAQKASEGAVASLHEMHKKAREYARNAQQ